jgi:sRNA-binding protein
MPDLVTNTPASPQLTCRARERRALEEIIATLGELFPGVFIVEAWQRHRPLKVAIHRDLIDRGILLPAECRALSRYCGRRAYQIALARGGPRFDLDGEPSGEVTAAEQESAKVAIACMDARAIQRAAGAKAARKAARAGKRAAPKAHAKPAAKTQSVPTPAGPRQPSSLADLKRAAAERKQAAMSRHDGCPPKAA